MGSSGLLSVPGGSEIQEAETPTGPGGVDQNPQREGDLGHGHPFEIVSRHHGAALGGCLVQKIEKPRLLLSPFPCFLGVRTIVWSLVELFVGGHFFRPSRQSGSIPRGLSLADPEYPRTDRLVRVRR